MKNSPFDRPDLTLAQIKASEQPRDSHGRFVSNYDYPLEDETREAAIPLELQVNAIGLNLEWDEDPFRVVDAAIDAEMAGYQPDKDEEEFSESGRRPETSKTHEGRYARNSHLRIEIAKRRYQLKTETIPPSGISDSHAQTGFGGAL